MPSEHTGRAILRAEDVGRGVAAVVFGGTTAGALKPVKKIALLRLELFSRKDSAAVLAPRASRSDPEVKSDFVA